jgi:hypothetical protein
MTAAWFSSYAKYASISPLVSSAPLTTTAKTTTYFLNRRPRRVVEAPGASVWLAACISDGQLGGTTYRNQKNEAAVLRSRGRRSVG